MPFTDLASLADIFSSQPNARMAHRTEAQEISTGRWQALVMPKSMSISMFLESCHPSICLLHCTFIRFKSTDMCLPADWLWAIFSCGRLVPLQCLGCVNGKIKHFFTRKSELPVLLLWWMFPPQIWHKKMAQIICWDLSYQCCWGCLGPGQRRAALGCDGAEEITKNKLRLFPAMRTRPEIALF